MRDRLQVLTWHVHGNYMHYLSFAPHDFHLVHDAARSPGLTGRSGTLPWRANVHEIALDALERARFDCVLYQSHAHYAGRERLPAAVRALPRIILEHDPPLEHPTAQLHPMQDPSGLIVHVTPFNALMWDPGVTPSTVIEHGVALLAPARYDGSIARGLVVINDLGTRGRRLGGDLYAHARDRIALDLVGMHSEPLGGLGEIENAALPSFMARYRFFFNPIRYTSLGLSVIEAMMVGLPVIGLATTEMSTVIENGVAGCVDTRPERLIEAGRELLADRNLAHALGEGARRIAHERFNIDRFAADWDRVLRTVAG